jgi:hypothetical protein|tara:strand:- start:502 stop:759 length:258 start_codon:yes stop_codon:yes gene_type:complete
MSFGGGGGTVGVSNHVHSAAVGEGGELSKTLTLMGGDVLYSLITDNSSAIAGLTANKGKWSATNVATFRNSVIAGVQAGTIEEVT